MMLKSFCLLTLLVGIQCRQVTRREPLARDSVDNNVHVDAKNTSYSDIPPDGYIAYGQQAQIGEFPWISLILTKHYDDAITYQCGGSVISDRHVITAAHCVAKAKYLQDITVILGEYNTNSYPTDCDIYNRCTKNHIMYPAQVTWHEKYDAVSISNDIAVLKLREQIKFDNVRPISLPPFDVDDSMYEDAPLTVAGWGGTEYSHTSQILLKTEVSLKTRPQCSRIYPYSYPEGHLCAGSSRYTNFCRGDSGGPLMMYYNNKFYISGIVSFLWADKHCGQSKATYYTNVFKYMNWIKWVMTH